MRKKTQPPSLNTEAVWLYADGPKGAKETGPYTGKWMPRVYATDVDRLWAQIVKACAKGTLGTGAKVSTRLGNEESPNASGGNVHVICVYTHDCRDLDDVGRVLRGIRELGIGFRLTYKEDGATFAGIYQGRGPITPAGLYVSQPGSLSFDKRRAIVPVSAMAMPAAALCRGENA